MQNGRPADHCCLTRALKYEKTSGPVNKEGRWAGERKEYDAFDGNRINLRGSNKYEELREADHRRTFYYKRQADKSWSLC